MSENKQDQSQEKSEQATPHRRKQARDQGQVPRSREIFSSIGFLVLAGVLYFYPPHLGPRISAMVHAMFTEARPPEDYESAGIQAIQMAVEFAAVMIGPLLLGLFVLVIIFGLAQGQFAFSTKALKPELSKISPKKGLKRLFGMEAGMNLVLQAMRIAVIGTVSYLLLRGAFEEIIGTAGAEPGFIATTLGTLSFRIAFVLSLIYLVVALVDYLFQVVKNEREMRMTKQEIRDEYKTTEGNPWVRSRIRSATLFRNRKRQLDAVPQADVVFANPHHRAVAIVLDPDIIAVPIIVAMGERDFALQIRHVAEQAGVPVVEDRPLAKLLLEIGKVGEPIPEETYVAVNKVLAWVYAEHGMRPSVRRFFDQVLSDD